MKIRCDMYMYRYELDREQTGFCRARKNTGKRIIPINYGEITFLAPDPTEKEPLAVFCSGTTILSAGSFGCSLRCPFCQNHEISMAGEGGSEAVYIKPGELATRVQALRPRGNIGVAYAYSRPLMGWEYVRDTARFIRATGMKNMIITNAGVTNPILDKILPLTDAMNIDLKGFAGQFYARLDGDLGVVRHFIQRAAEAYRMELTTPVAPGENDSKQEIKELASWVGGISLDIPPHITQFFPRWKMTSRGATSIRTVYSLAETTRKSLKHVFVGNC